MFKLVNQCNKPLNRDLFITVAGNVGAGKSTLTKLVAERLGFEAHYEKVDGNPYLEDFYKDQEKWGFHIQLYFLAQRFKQQKEIDSNGLNNIQDRSIYEDWYFAKVNKDLGRISELEFQMYEGLLENMLEELNELPKKAPDLMIYLTGSFETILDRIIKRGRGYELDGSLVSYYKTLWEGYDDWVESHYKASEVLTINIDEYDYVNNADDAEKVLEMIELKLKEIRAE